MVCKAVSDFVVWAMHVRGMVWCVHMWFYVFVLYMCVVVPGCVMWCGGIWLSYIVCDCTCCGLVVSSCVLCGWLYHV